MMSSGATARLSPLWLIVALALSSVAAQKCSLCPNGGVHSNPTGVIPQLNIPGNPNPTCDDAIQYAGVVDADSDTCTLLQVQAAFCGCDGFTTPESYCTLCSTGVPPNRGSLQTQYGDTCDELDTYLSFLTTEDCQTERGKDILRHAFGCECPSAFTTCAMCPDGTIDIANPDKVVPFFSGGSISGTGSPTCEELALIAASAPEGDILCDLIEAQAGFCGCQDVEPLNKCSFCPNGGVPANKDLVVATLDSCGDLYDYMAFMDVDTCESKRASDMRELDYVCGCPEAEPSCTLCPDGSEPPNPDLKIDGDDGPTCSEAALSTAGLSEETCMDRRNSFIGISSARCGCPGVDYPPCSIQQNPSLCTEELLATVDDDQDCECYNFCDGVFLQCSRYPGGLLSAQLCAGVPIAGCNRKSAMKNEEESSASGWPVLFSTTSASVLGGLMALLV